MDLQTVRTEKRGKKNMKCDIIITFIIKRFTLTNRQTERVVEASVPQKKERRKDEV